MEVIPVSTHTWEAVFGRKTWVVMNCIRGVLTRQPSEKHRHRELSTRTALGMNKKPEQSMRSDSSPLRVFRGD